jgi:translation initiation factor IF-3
LRPNHQGNQTKDTRTRINAAIKAPELRIITDSGENLGILSLADAIKAAEERKLDLIEISPKANPPIAKITKLVVRLVK